MNHPPIDPDNYATRIADSLAHDGVPVRMPAADARRLAERYGAEVEVVDVVTRREIALEIASHFAARVLRKAPSV